MVERARIRSDPRPPVPTTATRTGRPRPRPRRRRPAPAPPSRSGTACDRSADPIMPIPPLRRAIRPDPGRLHARSTPPGSPGTPPRPSIADARRRPIASRAVERTSASRGRRGDDRAGRLPVERPGRDRVEDVRTRPSRGRRRPSWRGRRSIRWTCTTSAARRVERVAEPDPPGRGVVRAAPGQDRAGPAVEQGRADAELVEDPARRVERIALAEAAEVEPGRRVEEPDGPGPRRAGSSSRSPATGPGAQGSK